MQEAPPYTGFANAIKEIAKHEGFKGFYRGLGPSLLMVSGEVRERGWLGAHVCVSVPSGHKILGNATSIITYLHAFHLELHACPLLPNFLPLALCLHAAHSLRTSLACVPV